MRKSKTKQHGKITQHTPTERLAMRRHKRKHGPSGMRRAERRKAKQEAHAAGLLADVNAMLPTIGGDKGLAPTSGIFGDVEVVDGEIVSCSCVPTCKRPCHGECGCIKCHNDYADFLSVE